MSADISLAALIETVLRDWATSRGVPLPDRPAVPSHEYVLEAITFGAASACAELDRLYVAACRRETAYQNHISQQPSAKDSTIQYWSGRLSMAQQFRREIEEATRRVDAGRAKTKSLSFLLAADPLGMPASAAIS